MKKIIYVLLFLLPINGAFAMGNKPADEKKEFRFEDYKNAEEAEAALLKFHPIGSSIDSIKSTLENAGAECNYRARSNKKIFQPQEDGDFLICNITKKGIITNKESRVIVDISPKDYDKILNLKTLYLNHLKFIP